MAYIMKKDIHSYIQQFILRNLERMNAYQGTKDTATALTVRPF